MGRALVVQAARPELSDTVLRAAYCMGVLKQSIAELQQQSMARCDTSWSEMGFKTQEQCSKDAPMLYEFTQAMQSDYEEKRKRYTQYVLVRTIGASDEQITAIHAVFHKGKRDTTLKKKTLDYPTTSKCSSAGTSLVDCVAKHDPTYANILRCQHEPDQLPF